MRWRAPVLSYRARRHWALVALLLWLPVYIVVAISVVGWFERPGILVELLIYAVLGVLWAVPLRAVFLGVGRPPENDPRS